MAYIYSALDPSSITALHHSYPLGLFDVPVYSAEALNGIFTANYHSYFTNKPHFESCHLSTETFVRPIKLDLIDKLTRILRYYQAPLTIWAVTQASPAGFRRPSQSLQVTKTSLNNGVNR